MRRWAEFRRSPLLPATVLVFLLAAAAGLFAGSYTYVLANPTPHRIPVAVVGSDRTTGGEGFVFLHDMNEALSGSLEIVLVDTMTAAREAVKAQRVFAVVEIEQPGTVAVEVSGASGSPVAEVLTKAARSAGAQTGLAVTVTDTNPLQAGDPRGLAIFYITLAAVIIGFVGAIQLNVHARELEPAERIAFTGAYALLGGFVIAAVVDWWLGALDLPFVASWLILALTMFTAGMIFTMFNALFGRWAIVPTWGLMVLVGNPASGGAVSWPLLPSPLAQIGRWLPPGASVGAQHTAVYFSGHQHALPFLVLAAWALVACTVFWVRQARQANDDRST